MAAVVPESGAPFDAALRATALGLGHGRAAHDIVADAIQHLIAVGGLRPGDRLPPERELAPTLGAARVTLRNAIKRLSAERLVTTTRGRSGGTFVAGGPKSRRESLGSLAMFDGTIDSGSSTAGSSSRPLRDWPPSARLVPTGRPWSY